MKTRPMGHPSAGAALLSPPGASAGGDGARRLELAVLVHLALFLLLATWGFGGNAPGPRRAMLAWGTLGFLLTCAGFGGRGGRRENWRRPLLWLAPLVLLDLLVAASAGNPELRGISLAGEPMLLKTGGIPGLPGSAGPRASLVALWLFNGIFLSCFNLVLLVRRRRRLRALLLFAAGNALVLAVFGTVQKLTDASGLYFGRVASPQAYFFASFVYHNHWGAFVVLMAALCLGLVWHYARHADRGFWHSPAFGGLLALLFLAASVPLSGSRSCTALLVVLLGGAFVRWAVATARDRRRRRRSPAGPLLAGALGVLAAGGLVYGLARPVIAQRVAKTFEQAAVLEARGDFGTRQVLYRDTWHMARDRLAFGWGMGSYPVVFTFYNTQPAGADRLPHYYHDAHSDWLQGVAELGLAGTGLVGLLGLLPLLSLHGFRRSGPLPRSLGAGCALVLLYAWVEFPFGSPAVVLAWWLCFFAAVRQGQLEAHAAGD